jgi:hypothetical protein
MAVARSANLLLPTTTQLGAMGMMDRKVNEYNAITFAEAGEDDDTAAQKFSKDALSTLTPAAHRARIDITDQRATSDFDSEIANASSELGNAAAKYVDVKIATNFSSATAGTIGSAGTVMTWEHITSAMAIVANANVPANAPVFCALHPYQWEPLLKAATLAGSSISQNPAFTDRVVAAPNYFTMPQFVGVTFVITNSIAIDASDDAYGCMYVPQAFAVDLRKAFDVRPERNESRELTELNSSIWFAHGTWRPAFACAILSDASTPSV